MNFSIVVIIATAVAVCQIVESAELTEQEQILISECSAQEGASDEDVAVVISMEMPSTRAQRCLTACISEKIGVMKNNKLDVAATIELVRTEITDDPGTLKIATDISNDCAEVTDEDRCDAAYKISVCIEDATKARGLTFDR